MITYKLGEIEMKFCDIVWESEPVSSGEVVKLAWEKLLWKKSTTYTVLRKLCEKGILQNKDSVVTSLISKADYNALRSEKFVEETFSGSLPSFLTAFSSRKKLSQKEIEEIEKIINENRER